MLRGASKGGGYPEPLRTATVAMLICCLLLARRRGKPVGCAALRTLAPGVGEIKPVRRDFVANASRMWVSSAGCPQPPGNAEA